MKAWRVVSGVFSILMSIVAGVAAFNVSVVCDMLQLRSEIAGSCMIIAVALLISGLASLLLMTGGKVADTSMIFLFGVSVMSGIGLILLLSGIDDYMKIFGWSVTAMSWSFVWSVIGLVVSVVSLMWHNLTGD